VSAQETKNTPVKTLVASDSVGVPSAVAWLQSGGVVALPTETVYGLAADALNPLACARIFEAKSRPLNDPLIVHLPEEEWLDRVAIATPLARALAEAFWPGPLTLVLTRREIVPDIVTDGLPTVAVRWSLHPVFDRVIRTFGRPLAAPSANRFGRISPTAAEHVMEELDGRIPLIIDGGECPQGIESTIVRVLDGALEILRNGPVTADELAAFAPVRDADRSVPAPGNWKSHYAPATPVEFLEPGANPDAGAGLLAWTASGDGYGAVEHLSHRQDLREGAARLYACLRRLDHRGLQRIVVEPIPENGLGAALMERLRKAAAR
jgi:L-threonylcarbamoyladenylate synthase